VLDNMELCVVPHVSVDRDTIPGELHWGKTECERSWMGFVQNNFTSLAYLYSFE